MTCPFCMYILLYQLFHFSLSVPAPNVVEWVAVESDDGEGEGEGVVGWGEIAFSIWYIFYDFPSSTRFSYTIPRVYYIRPYIFHVRNISSSSSSSLSLLYLTSYIHFYFIHFMCVCVLCEQESLLIILINYIFLYTPLFFPPHSLSSSLFSWME